MDVDDFLRRPASRRGFFRGAGISLTAGSAVFVAACGDDDRDDGGTARPGSGDVNVLNSALGLEYTAVAAYRAAEPLLKGGLVAVSRRFLEQEQEHADGLAREIRQLGGTPAKPRASYDLPRLADETGVLNFLTDLENTAVAAYIDALPKLTDPELRAIAAAILTNEAEHISVLLEALDRPPVPEAFVTGRED